MNAIDSFRSALRAAGLDYAGPVLADGKLHRFRAGEDREPNSWYVLHDGPLMAAAFGCWKRGIKETWCERDVRFMPPREQQRVREQWQRADEQRKQDEAERQAEARTEAEGIQAQAAPASPAHAYLVAKGVKPLGDMREHDGRLVIPLRDASGTIHSLQFIGHAGEKRFLPGGKVAGTFYTISGPDTGPLVICEGYATGASIHEATGRAVVCAMNCGNLLAVAQSLGAKWPDREFIIAADNDQFTNGNPGLTKATEAAKAIGAKLAIPQFTDLTNRPTDFNDLQQIQGTAQVKTQIEAATRPKECGDTIISPPALPVVPRYSPPPLEILPTALRDFVKENADALGVDVAFIFLPLLSALAAAIGNTRVIRAKRGFIQPAILWTSIVARSGSKKSPALAAATRFFHERERDLLRANKRATEIFDRCRREWTDESKGGRGEEPKQPPRLTCLLDDLTLPVIATILSDNPRGALVTKDELAGWFGSFGQFSKGGAAADVSGWLSLFNGDSLMVDRKTNRESHRIFNPRLSITGCIPPAVLTGALTADFFQRGLPARMMFAAPPPLPNTWTDKEVSERIEIAANDTFKRLFALEPGVTELMQTPVEIAIGPDGLEVFKEFYNQVGQHAVESGEREEAAWAKLTGGALRLALVGHLSQGFDSVPVGGSVMESAVELALWFGHEAERIYHILNDPPENVVRRRLVEFIEQRRGKVSVKEITDNFRSLKNQTEKTEKLLNELVASGIGHWTPIVSGAKGGRPCRKFELVASAVSCPRPLNPGVSQECGGIADADTSDSAEFVLPNTNAGDIELVEEIV